MPPLPVVVLIIAWIVLTRCCSVSFFSIAGKNKICDRICELANFEREYIQLHRDSTIGQLTLSPSVEDGKIVWKDSPLVRAVIYGRALVIDEADKAPLEVVAVLKSLVEDGQLLLADGRRILRHGANEDNGKMAFSPVRYHTFAGRPEGSFSLILNILFSVPQVTLPSTPISVCGYWRTDPDGYFMEMTFSVKSETVLLHM